MQPFAIIAQRVVLPSPDRPDRLDIVPAAIIIRGHLIERVDRVHGDLAEYAGQLDMPVTDYGERMITPAFVNAHTHLALVGLRGGVASLVARGNMVEDLFYDWEHQLDADDVRAFARMGAYECLLHGTGVVWDHYWFADALIDALRDTGLGGVVGPALQDLMGPGVPWWEEQLDATVRLAGDTTLAADGIAIALAPHATDTVSPELWKRCTELASSLDVPIHAHVAQSLEEFERRVATDGCSPVQWLDRIGVLKQAPTLLMVHMLYAADADLNLLDPGRHILGLCPYSQLQFSYPAPLLHWERFGLRWFTATDASCSNDSMNLQKELRWAGGWRNAPVGASRQFSRFAETGRVEQARDLWGARRERHSAGEEAAHPHRLLSSVWQDPGQLHPSFRCGTVAAGAQAHLVVWDLDHPSFWPATDPLRALTYGDTSAAIHAMMVAGKRIGVDGDFARSLVTSDAYRQALEEATQRFAALQR